MTLAPLRRTPTPTSEDLDGCLVNKPSREDQAARDRQEKGGLYDDA